MLETGEQKGLGRARKRRLKADARKVRIIIITTTSTWGERQCTNVEDFAVQFSSATNASVPWC
jgi:hypothetical protein